ncbi:MAG: bifunctional MaoC family dehydratase/OB-fold nucleic acid binding domain-containing protein [Deltaproteobacteria bacterium]|nr:bifunctional MaoC family dehydratase/OB-fold nucleic acid binding domain-containing protein [Deltaproteobacteria bacterium]MBW2448119.1 bifunctional MaoC family dehydratase/OB-fold nucleic acid binding domain-containing protein [Deltaproteobacteria bacterium]
MSNPAEAKRALEARLQEFVGTETGPPTTGPDLVNEAMIRHWAEAMEDRNPIYTDAAAAKESVHGGIVAPPTMMQAWILGGMAMAQPPTGDEPRDEQNNLHAILTENGYPSVVATNCEQEYHRYLKPGDEVQATTVIESISDQKATALGTGYFINTRTEFSVDGEAVGWMKFRVLKFTPNEAPAAASDDGGGGPMSQAPRRLRPTLGHDNKWWWDGLEEGKFLIQKCSACGVQRHPPRPMCGECQSIEWGSVESTMKGAVHSYVVIHHPPVPGYDYPLVCALIDLDEGIRFVSNVIDCAPGDVHVGMKVEGRIEQVDDEMKLPLFRAVK